MIVTSNVRSRTFGRAHTGYASVMNSVLSLTRMTKLLSIVLLWGGTFVASLAIAKLPLGHWASLCGPWGCLPETAPLLSVHAMWMTVIGGVAMGLRFAISLFGKAKPWWGIHLGSLLALVIFLGADANAYLAKGGSVSDLGRRALFTLITSTDLPLSQCALASLACGLSCVNRKRQQRLLPRPKDASAALLENL